MAKEKISMAYDLKQNCNENSPTYGLWYPRAVRRDTLSLRGLADHIADHGSIYTGHGDRHLTQTWVNVPVPTTRVIAE